MLNRQGFATYTSLARALSSRKFQIACLIAWLLAATANAATWYVDANANGGNNGTSWNDAWTSLTTLSTVSPGDTVYISGGPSGSTRTYNVPGAWIFKSGSPGQPVTYAIGQDSSHDGTAVFNSTSGGTWIEGSARNNMLISGKAGDGQMHFRLAGYQHIFYVNDGAQHTLNWHIAYVDCTNVAQGGNDLHAITKVELDHCAFAVTNLAADHFCFAKFAGTSFGDNSIHDSTITVPNSGNGSGADALQWNGSGFSIYNNNIIGYVSAYTGGQHQDGWQGTGGSSYIAIYGNYFINIANYPIFGDGYFGGFSHLWVYNNIVTLTDPGIQASNPPQGIAIGPDGGSFSNLGSYPAFTDVVVANNLIADYGPAGSAHPHAGINLQNNVGQHSVFTNCVVSNNLYVNSGSHGLDAAVVNLGNVVLTSAQAASTFVSYTPSRASNDYHLTSAGKNLIQNGANLAAFFTIDKDGATRSSSSSWMIGPFTGSGTGSPTPPPVVTPPPSPTTEVVPQGASVTLVSGANSSANIALQWYDNNLPIAGATAGSLTLNGVTPANNGMYTLMVTTVSGSVESAGIQLTVTPTPANTGPANVIPAFTAQPFNQWVMLQGTVVFTVAATGSPAPSFSWKRNGVPLRDGGEFSGSQTATLMIRGAVQGDSGAYSVTASNVAGAVSSQSGQLTVANPQGPGMQPVVIFLPVVSGRSVTSVSLGSSAPAS